MISTHLAYSHMLVAFVMAGAGMALVFAPSANAVLSSVRPAQAGQASGANNAIREVGGVLGVAVLASVFTGSGGYSSPQAFVAGLRPGALGRGGGAGARRHRGCGAAVHRARRRWGTRRGEPRRAGPLHRGARGGAGLSSQPAPDAEPARRRVPAAQRREELIAAAVHEFARGGLHGTAVERVARAVGVAQPYVFSLFSNKRELFLAAVERSFQVIADMFTQAAGDFREGRAPEGCSDALEAMGYAYKELLLNDRDLLMLQHQCYAACDDEVVRTRVRHGYAQLVDLATPPVRRRAGADRRLLPTRHGAQCGGRARGGGPVGGVRVGARRAERKRGHLAAVHAIRLARGATIRPDADPLATESQRRSGRRQVWRRSRGELARSGALMVLAVLITLFAVFNLNQVRVDWIFGSGNAPLIVVIVLSLLVGIVLTHFAERIVRKRR